MKKALVAFALLAFLFPLTGSAADAPVAAEASAPEAVTQSTTATDDAAQADALFCPPAPLFADAANGQIVLAATGANEEEGRPTEAFCVADCQVGSDKSANCAGSCTAVDQNCASGQQGYVQCAGGSKQYCSPCGGQTCTAQCETGPNLTATCASGCAVVQNQNCAAGIAGMLRCNGTLKTLRCAPCPACPNDYCNGGPCTTNADCCGNVDGGGVCSSQGTCLCP